MSTRTRRARRSRAFIPFALTLLCACVGLVAGCGGAATSTGGGTPPARPADLPPLVVTVCLDRTPSFDRTLFNDAKNLLADAIVARATQGQLGATIYVTLIGRNSFDTSATVRTIIVPAVPSAPAASSGTPDNNVFQKATQTAVAVSATASAAHADATAAALADSAAKHVQADVAFLRALNPTTDSPTDILGCVSRAADRFQRAGPDAQKLLIMATDLHQEGIQQTARDRSLPGVNVKVIEWACQDAADCDGRKAFWKDELVTKDKAAAFATYDPAETRAQLASHLFSYDA